MTVGVVLYTLHTCAHECVPIYTHMPLYIKKQTHRSTHKGNMEFYPFTANDVTHLIAITAVGPNTS